MAEFDPRKTLTVDAETGELLARVAQRLGLSVEEVIRRGAQAMESTLPVDAAPVAPGRPMRETVEAYWRERGVPLPIGEPVDRNFYDWLSDD